MKTILGPARCSQCRSLIWWARRRDGWPPCWVNRDEKPHHCKGTP